MRPHLFHNAWVVLVLLWVVLCHGFTPVQQQVFDLFKICRGKQVGMITNPTSIDEELTFLPDYYVLNPFVPFNISCFFAPEHGLRGDRQNGQKIDDYIDPLTNRWVYSLYGERLAPTPDQLQNLDFLLYDIQDVGARFYTYIWTMTYCMEAAAEANVSFVVFDRPNPVGLDCVQGPPLTQDEGLIGRVWPGQPWSVPNRYGLTVGELAVMVNDAWMNPKVKLHVVKIPMYYRDTNWADLNRPWVLPSPNMPTWQGTAMVYPGYALFEDTDISEGRGTTRPFEIIGSTFLADPVQSQILLEALKEETLRESLLGTGFRSTFFVPTFDKFANRPCGGVQAYVLSPQEFDPIRGSLTLLKVLTSLWPSNFTVHTSIDGKFGIPDLHNRIYNETVAELVGSYQENLRNFIKFRRQYLLYSYAN